MISGQFFLFALLYLLAARGCLAGTTGRWRTALFAVLNIAAIWFLFYPSKNFSFPYRLGAYVALVALQYVTLHLFAHRKGWLPWVAFFTPLAALILLKYVSALFEPIWVRLGWRPMGGFAEYFLGISYLAFRTSHVVLEVRNGVVRKPDFWEYLGFSFFVPTLLVGPISPYSQFQKGFAGPDRTELPLGRCALRVLIGCTKFIFLASLCNQLSYAGLLLDGHQHPWVDLVVRPFFTTCIYTATFPDSAMWRSGRRVCWAFRWRRIFAIPLPPAICKSFGTAGTSRSRATCVTFCSRRYPSP